MVEIPVLPSSHIQFLCESSVSRLDCHSTLTCKFIARSYANKPRRVFDSLLYNIFALQVVRRNVEEEMPRQVG